MLDGMQWMISSDLYVGSEKCFPCAEFKNNTMANRQPSQITVNVCLTNVLRFPRPRHDLLHILWPVNIAVVESATNDSNSHCFCCIQ